MAGLLYFSASDLLRMGMGNWIDIAGRDDWDMPEAWAVLPTCSAAIDFRNARHAYDSCFLCCSQCFESFPCVSSMLGSWAVLPGSSIASCIRDDHMLDFVGYSMRRLTHSETKIEKASKGRGAYEDKQRALMVPALERSLFKCDTSCIFV